MYIFPAVHLTSQNLFLTLLFYLHPCKLTFSTFNSLQRYCIYFPIYDWLWPSYPGHEIDYSTVDHSWLLDTEEQWIHFKGPCFLELRLSYSPGTDRWRTKWSIPNINKIRANVQTLARLTSTHTHTHTHRQKAFQNILFRIQESSKRVNPSDLENDFPPRSQYFPIRTTYVRT
jgi:hypothetical protein